MFASMSSRSGIDVPGLWQAYRSRPSVGVRNQLLCHYLPFVRSQAAAFLHRLPAHVRFDELASAGFDGLLHAVQSFRPGRGVAFEVFARPRIQGAVIDEIRRNDSLSRTLRAFEKLRIATEDRLASCLHHPPSDAETAAEMGLSVRRFLQLRRQTRLRNVLSLSGLVDNHRGAPRPSSDSPAFDDPASGDPAKAIARELLQECAASDRLTSAGPRGDRRRPPGPGLAAALTDREKYIIGAYYAGGLTLKQIGATLHLTRARIKQIRDRALRHVRPRLAEAVRRCNRPDATHRGPSTRPPTARPIADRPGLAACSPAPRTVVIVRKPDMPRAARAHCQLAL